MTLYKDSLKLHKTVKGKLELKPKVEVKNIQDLSLVYTPGVAAPCKLISKNPSKVYDLTFKANTIIIVSDGSRVLGLGNLGGLAVLPVLEGKALIFKLFADINAIPIALNVKDAGEIINTIIAISPAFSGVNLEDIERPKCFIIETELQKRLDIPVFHDDQHGTAIAVLAALLNSLKLVGKKISDIKIVILGAGAAGIAVAKYTHTAGCKNIIVCDSRGIIHSRRTDLDFSKKEILGITNRDDIEGGLEEALKDADVVIGLSTIPNLLKPAHIKLMSDSPIVFALTNPIPEITPVKAKKAGAKIVATGRSDLPNQINNSLVFPGIFRGALDIRATTINMEMKMAAVKALLKSVPEDTLSEDFIIPSMMNKNIVFRIAEEVAKAAIKSGVARIKKTPNYTHD
ncbi:MAG: NADP-dependent malic enzyme [Candidatus Odinarchaeum yellowstonii]|uniref:NADP-dependent malic enzyme n=1 Tax=Odinarchaeota yellowstonii (strain LCB_4) TaxID=1841599 RepID=A0AAF0IAG1_ODILC|nr:MAG: NADP-dependent malic enzyme [Candidatus Odinarchaeum yellowstonii]